MVRSNLTFSSSSSLNSTRSYICHITTLAVTSILQILQGLIRFLSNLINYRIHEGVGVGVHTIKKLAM